MTHPKRISAMGREENGADRIAELEALLAAQLAGHRLCAKQSTDNLLRARAAERERDALLTAGKYLAVKLAEVYRAAGIKPADCGAIRDWMAALPAPHPQETGGHR